MTTERDDIATIADEYVLGLLEEPRLSEIEAEMENNIDLKASIAQSRDRFLPLDTSVAPAEVSADLWQRIEAELPVQQGHETKQTSALQTAASNDNIKKPWRMTALSAIAASLLLAIALGLSLNRTVEPVVIAVLLNAQGEVQAVVEDFGNANASVRLLGDVSVPAGKTIQVWTLPSKEMGPISLGLLDGASSADLRGPALPQPRGDQLYELTLEQAGGSPTGRPTGPILAKGFAREPL